VRSPLSSYNDRVSFIVLDAMRPFAWKGAGVSVSAIRRVVYLSAASEPPDGLVDAVRAALGGRYEIRTEIDPDQQAPIAHVGLAEPVEGPRDLAARCPFPVLVPASWPDGFGEPEYAVMTPSIVGPLYSVRARKHGDETRAFVALTGSGRRAGTRHFPRSARLPFVRPPTFVHAARRSAHVRVETPETVVSVAVHDSRAFRTAVGIARSLRPYPRVDESRAG
jgi:hypothetical protein